MKQNTYAESLYNFIATAIKRGMTGEVIANVMVIMGIKRETAIEAIAMVGTKLNMESNPAMNWEQAFKVYAGI